MNGEQAPGAQRSLPNLKRIQQALWRNSLREGFQAAADPLISDAECERSTSRHSEFRETTIVPENQRPTLRVRTRFHPRPSLDSCDSVDMCDNNIWRFHSPTASSRREAPNC
jgi:hypothetical protein